MSVPSPGIVEFSPGASLTGKSLPDVKPNAREIAIQHAKIIQFRKDLEGEILESLIRLSEYPLVRNHRYSAANPAPADVDDFKHHIRLFQPSDYDDLIEERNANGLCGYTLCSNPKITSFGGGEWKLVKSTIMRRKEYEQWCSPECARRALYVKVQLNETAAWERLSMKEIEIELIEEQGQETSEQQMTRRLAQLHLDQERKTTQTQNALALERGDPSAANVQAGRTMKVTIRPKEVSKPLEEKQEADENAHLRLEGYVPKLNT